MEGIIKWTLVSKTLLLWALTSPSACFKIWQSPEHRGWISL